MNCQIKTFDSLPSISARTAFAANANAQDFSEMALLERKEKFKDKLKSLLDDGIIDYVDASRAIALFVHGDIHRRNGTIYFNHVREVAAMDHVVMPYTDPDLAIVAWAHDVPEETTREKNLKRPPELRKSPWTLDDFRMLGFSEKVVQGIGMLQKPDDVLYLDHIETISMSWVAPVKYRDNFHNHSDDGVTESRYKLYTLAMPYLYQTMHNPDATPAGSSIIEFAKRAGMYERDLLADYSVRLHKPTANSNQSIYPT